MLKQKSFLKSCVHLERGPIHLKKITKGNFQEKNHVFKLLFTKIIYECQTQRGES